MKASVNSAFIELGANPKPSDLTLGRMNSIERLKEVRTRRSCNSLG